MCLMQNLYQSDYSRGTHFVLDNNCKIGKINNLKYTRKLSFAL